MSWPETPSAHIEGVVQRHMDLELEHHRYEAAYPCLPDPVDKVVVSDLVESVDTSWQETVAEPIVGSVTISTRLSANFGFEVNVSMTRVPSCTIQRLFKPWLDNSLQGH